MIRKALCNSTFLLTLLAIVSVSEAGQLFRFKDESGTPTLSKHLPSEAAQKGYDILDDETMRLIERIPPALTEAELAEQAVRAEKQAEQRAIAEQQAKVEAERQRQQRLYDSNLLALYRSEAELDAAQDKELSYLIEKQNLLKDKIPDLEQKLIRIQQEAAQREIEGQSISNNLQKRLMAAGQELTNHQKMHREISTELEQARQQYADDRQRLRYLLERKKR
ncbi:hypothetical protein Q7C_1636 [Methylophaga frappieri]|uniref:DUF4124 domain-containing protein n=1 Tax=Methylophaga frappieri (strain ATCC BAA-2434 / DSM 25690 / JAM7) TaxID=754477 RepID=I1YIP1_METFJ|nr:hypothetical protein [Methylophaga frappieri]AFJ02784.1 hypothetical protein Q7C_1636 [Methylophaga frappieri]